MSARFKFLRHADARHGNIRHTKESPLTVFGFQQAEDTANHFQNTKFDACVASPAKRVQQTLDEIAKKTPIFINTWQILREISRRVDGLTYEETAVYSRQRREAIDSKNMNWRYDPRDDSFQDINERAVVICRELKKEFDDQHCLVGGHSQVLSAVHTIFKFGERATKEEFFLGFNRYFLRPACYSDVTWSPRKGWQILSFNNHKHLSDPDAD